jgi:hypothetical protein
VLRELSNGTEDRRDPGPPKGITEGTWDHAQARSARCRPHATDMTRAPLGIPWAEKWRHSVGGKVAISMNSAEVLQSGHGFNGRCGQ